MEPFLVINKSRRLSLKHTETETMKYLLLALLAADPRVVEVFKDKGDTFIRAGTNRGLKVGAEVVILGDKIGDTDEYRAGGKATVLEVWETLARVSPDSEASKLKEIKLAKVGGAAPAAAKPAPVAAAGAVEAPAAAAPGLKGHAAFGGIGPAKRITLYNDSSAPWTNCELRLPNNRHYRMASLRAGDQEGVMITRFSQDGTELDRPLDSIAVRCDQGASRFSFSM
jgi:hypothetical protein